MGICVTGMHRGGTSLIAQILHRGGVDFGAEEDLKPASADNPDGYFEHEGFLAVNKDLLEQIGGGWDLPPDVEEGWQQRPELEPLAERGRRLVARFGGREPWGWKDPRNSLTVPFWQMLDPGLRSVVCVRNPLEVCRSLGRRNGMSQTLAYRLWAVYYERACTATPPERRVVTHYDAYFADAGAEARRVLEGLGVDDADARVSGIQTAARPRLRHHHVGPHALREAGAPAALIELYDALCEEAGPVLAGARTASSQGASPAASASPRRAPTSTKRPALRRHRKADGSGKRFDVLGAQEFSVLAGLGLREQHTVLELGCGALRLGRLLIPYLLPGGYTGVETDGWLLGRSIEQEVGHDLVRLREADLRSDAETEPREGRGVHDFVVTRLALSPAQVDYTRQRLETARAALHANSLVVAFLVDPAEDDESAVLGVDAGGASHRERLADLAARVGLQGQPLEEVAGFPGLLLHAPQRTRRLPAPVAGARVVGLERELAATSRELRETRQALRALRGEPLVRALLRLRRLTHSGRPSRRD